MKMDEEYPELPFWEPRKHRRNTDPVTSAAAASQAKNMAAQHMKIIEACLCIHGPLTADEISMWTILDPVQVNRRTSDLIRAKIIVDTGKQRRARSGRYMRVVGIRHDS